MSVAARVAHEMGVKLGNEVRARGGVWGRCGMCGGGCGGCGVVCMAHEMGGGAKRDVEGVSGCLWRMRPASSLAMGRGGGCRWALSWAMMRGARGRAEEGVEFVDGR